MDDLNPRFDPNRFHPGRIIARGLANRVERGRGWVRETASTASLHLSGRRLTHGELGMIAWMFGPIPRIQLTRVTGHNFWWPVPNSRAMTPDGNMYFPAADYYPDFSAPDVPVDKRALFMHESTHLYQHYKVGRWLMVEAPFDRNYDYEIAADKPFEAYGIEQQGQMVQDFYLLRHGRRRVGNRYKAGDYAGLLPLRR